MHSARTQRVLVPTGLAGMSGLVSSLHHCHRYTVTAARETVGAKDSFGAKTWSPKQGKQTHLTMRKSQQKPKNSNINNRSALISHSSHNVKLIASRTHPHSSPCIFHHSNYQTSYRMHPHSPLLAHRQGSRAIPHECALIRHDGSLRPHSSALRDRLKQIETIFKVRRSFLPMHGQTPSPAIGSRPVRAWKR